MPFLTNADAQRHWNAYVNDGLRNYRRAYEEADRKGAEDALLFALEETIRNGQRQSPDLIGQLNARRVAQFIFDNWNILAG